MSWQMTGNSGWGMLFWTAVIVGLVALVAVVILWQRLGNSQRTSSAGNTDKDLLKQRLAKGQISTEDYEELIRQIDGQ